MSRADDPRTIGAVERAFRIIDILEREGGRAGFGTLTDRLDISKGTVSTYLATLEQAGYIRRRDGQYALSLRYLSLGETARSLIPVYDIIEEEIQELADRTGERCQFAMEERGRAVVVCMAEGENAVNPSFSIGKTDYLHCIGLGKAMLAHVPRHEQEAVVDTHGLPEFTENTITDRETLFEELGRIRERGYAIDNEERIPGVRCVAVPILDEHGEVLGAISVSGPATRMTDDRIENEIRAELGEVANVIEVDAHLS